ncbi:hypothetical protein FHS18_004775 [Paenibacillus phyllosphaerae]|uniref:Uncharacterized protein n=1 Tax=Paenibacillus phyllosphaerae TaxID=274593 RepID=A0A7W5B200_9BACL|nr:zinc ribbon domain-containing protein [Paenibacillus phyllosphaerae]MBB3112674.1 hypothetical protein [Paenibacillus phyllosphaerae]
MLRAQDGIGMLPLMSWMSGLATGIALLIGCGIVAAMFMIIRLSTSDSDKHKELREFVETLFGTPAHLRPDAAKTAESETAAASVSASREAFTEPCPACAHHVTERDVDCPSCGLRLQ